MKRVSMARVLVAIVMFVVGSYLWNQRYDKTPSFAKRLDFHGAILTEAKSMIPLEGCQELSDGQSWLVLVMRARLFGDGIARGYFQSSKEQNGIAISYEPDNERLGPNVSVSIPGGDTRFVVPIRTVRREEELETLVGVSSHQVRIVANGTDKEFLPPTGFGIDVHCDSVQVGSVGQLKCDDCAVSVAYLAGSGVTRMNELLDSVSNRNATHARRLFGTLLTVLAVFSLTPWGIVGSHWLLQKMAFKRPSEGR
jgi:hypothetical protein